MAPAEVQGLVGVVVNRIRRTSLVLVRFFGAWAAIAVDGRRVVQGLYRAAVPGQRVPLHLATDVEAEGVIKLQAQWSGFGDTAQLGITGYPVLRALVHPRGTRLIDLG